MIQRTIVLNLLAFVLLFISLGFASAQVSGRKAGTNQADGMLYKQAQMALSKSNFGEARTLLTNLIDSYPDSGYVPRAKLSIADCGSWNMRSSKPSRNIATLLRSFPIVQKYEKPNVESTLSREIQASE